MKTPPSVEYLVLHPEAAPRFLTQHVEYNVSKSSAIQTVQAAAELAGRSQEQLTDLVKVWSISGSIREYWELNGVEIPNSNEVLLNKERKAIVDIVTEANLSRLTQFFKQLDFQRLRQINFKWSGKMSPDMDVSTWFKQVVSQVPIFGAFDSKTGDVLGMALAFQTSHDVNCGRIELLENRNSRTPVVVSSLLDYILVAGPGQFHRFEAHVPDSDLAAIAAFRYYSFEEQRTGTVGHFYLDLKTPEVYAAAQ